MKNITEMKRKKGELVKQARALISKAEEEKRELTAEERTSCDKLLADVTAMEDDISREERLQQMEMGAAAAVKPHGEDQKKEKRAAFFKYMREGRTGLNPEERALVEDTAGLYMVPEDLDAEIYRTLPTIDPIRRLANVRVTNRDKVRVRSLTELSVGWGKLETGTEITESDMTPSQDYIYVEDLYGLTKIGEDELQDSDANLAAAIVDSFSMAIGKEEAKRFVIGRGHTYSEPAGVAVDTQLISSTYATDLATADTIVPDDLIKVEYALPPQYLNGACFVMHRKAELAVRLVKQTNGPYLWQPSLQVGMPPSFDSFPVYNSADMNYPADTVDEATAAIFGNWKLGYMIVDRQGITIQRLNELYAEAGLVGFKVHFRVGGGIIRRDAFRTLNNEST